jgi:hypothetical protein
MMNPWISLNSKAGVIVRLSRGFRCFASQTSGVFCDTHRSSDGRIDDDTAAQRARGEVEGWGLLLLLRCDGLCSCCVVSLAASGEDLLLCRFLQAIILDSYTMAQRSEGCLSWDFEDFMLSRHDKLTVAPSRFLLPVSMAPAYKACGETRRVPHVDGVSSSLPVINARTRRRPECEGDQQEVVLAWRNTFTGLGSKEGTTSGEVGLFSDSF